MSERPGSVTIVACFLFLFGLIYLLTAIQVFQFMGAFFGGFGSIISSNGDEKNASAASAMGTFFGGIASAVLIFFALAFFAIGFLVLKGNRIARWAAVLFGVSELLSFSLPFPIHSIIGIIFLYVLLGDQKSKDFFAK